MPGRLLDISGPFIAERIVTELRVHKEGGRILDLGCGKAVNVKVLRGYGYESYGLDLRLAFSPNVRDFCTSATAMKLPFKEGTFDAVTESLMFSQGFEIENWLDAEYRTSLREIKRVLVPNGVMVSSWFQNSGILRATGMSKVHRHALEVGLKPLPSQDREMLVFQRPLE